MQAAQPLSDNTGRSLRIATVLGAWKNHLVTGGVFPTHFLRVLTDAELIACLRISSDGARDLDASPAYRDDWHKLMLHLSEEKARRADADLYNANPYALFDHEVGELVPENSADS